MRVAFLLQLIWLFPLSGFAQEASSVPKPIPETRDAMKRAIEALKKANPRIPFPELSEEQKKKPTVNNGIMRQYYLSSEVREARFSRGSEPGMILDNTFKVMLFWIVSRGNNCHYCLGHQEAKLANAGLSEDQIAALDFDWRSYTQAEQTAFAFTQKLAMEPQKIDNTDLEAMRKYFKDNQILEIVFSVGSFAAMNRWTDSLGIPQEANPLNMKTPTFLTPTSEKYQNQKSVVCPLSRYTRAPLESRKEVEAAFENARKREPRIALVDVESTKKLLPADWNQEIPEYARLLAHFPKIGISKTMSFKNLESKGKLNTTLRAQIRWIVARNDRAWYALGRAYQDLKAMGQKDDTIFAIDAEGKDFTEAERACFAFVRKLTVQPFLITDADIAKLRKHYDEFEVAEIVHRVGSAVMFDRLTETFTLKLER